MVWEWIRESGAERVAMVQIRDAHDKPCCTNRFKKFAEPWGGIVLGPLGHCRLDRALVHHRAEQGAWTMPRVHSDHPVGVLGLFFGPLPQLCFAQLVLLLPRGLL